MSARTGRLRRRLVARYGAGPLHLLAVLGCFAVAGYATGRAAAAGMWAWLLVWLAGAAVAHDLVLYPLYALADVAARRRPRRRGHRTGAVWPPWTNHVRVPTVLSGLLLLIWAPLVLGLSEQAYRRSTGLGTSPYLGRWVLVTCALFAASALVYVVRLLRPARDVSGRTGRSGGSRR